MAIRELDFITAVETSAIPTSGTPTSGSDLITKDYADDTYTPKAEVYGVVDDITELKTVASGDRFDKQMTFVDGSDVFYKFDADSIAAGDDNLVVAPNSGTGRWIKIEFAGSGSNGTASSVEQLQQKLDNERSRIFTQDLDNSKGLSGAYAPAQKNFYGNLMSNAASGVTTLDIGWNLMYPSSGDPNMDATTNWSVQSAATGLTATGAAGEFDSGASGLKFDKNNSATTAEIRQDRGAQDLVLASNTRAWFKCKMPSITGLTNIYLRIYADSTSNYQQYNLTTQYDSSAISSGSFNKFLVDFTTASSTTGGTGWNYATQMARYIGLGVTASSAGQTYTGIIFDSCYFSTKSPQDIGVIANEFTIHDNSTTSNIVFSSSNTRSDGPLTITAATATALTGGASGTARARIQRSTALVGSDQIYFDTDSTLSGTVTTSQNFRIGKMLRESVSGSYGVFTNLYTPQIYKVTSVSGNVLGLDDASASTANLVSTNVLHGFSRKVIDCEEYFSYLGDLTMSAGSTASSGITSVTGSGAITGTIAVGDYVAKKHLAMAFSSVGSATNEAFATITEDASPDGIKLKANQFSYPNTDTVWAHFPLGDISLTEAARNRKGLGANLTATGAINNGDSFLQGRLSASNFTGTGIHYSLSDANSVDIQGDDEMVQVSLWFNATGFTGTNRTLVGKRNSGFTTGWTLSLDSSANTVLLETRNGTRASGAFTPNAWTHILAVFNDSGTQRLYINNVLVGTDLTTTPNASSELLYFGKSASGANFGIGIKMADAIFWRNGAALTEPQRSYLYAGGFYRNTFKFDDIEYRYTVNGQTGQKITSRGTMTRTTTAIAPLVKKTGWMKTS